MNVELVPEPDSTSIVALSSVSTTGFVANTCNTVTFNALLMASDAIARVKLVVTEVSSDTCETTSEEVDATSLAGLTSKSVITLPSRTLVILIRLGAIDKSIAMFAMKVFE